MESHTDRSPAFEFRQSRLLDALWCWKARAGLLHTWWHDNLQLTNPRSIPLPSEADSKLFALACAIPALRPNTTVDALRLRSQLRSAECSTVSLTSGSIEAQASTGAVRSRPRSRSMDTLPDAATEAAGRVATSSSSTTATGEQSAYVPAESLRSAYEAAITTAIAAAGMPSGCTALPPAGGSLVCAGCDEPATLARLPCTSCFIAHYCSMECCKSSKRKHDCDPCTPKPLDASNVTASLMRIDEALERLLTRYPALRATGLHSTSTPPKGQHPLLPHERMVVELLLVLLVRSMVLLVTASCGLSDWARFDGQKREHANPEEAAECAGTLMKVAECCPHGSRGRAGSGAHCR